MPSIYLQETHPALYSVVTDILVEDFDEKAIIFLASRDLLITVNRAAGRLLELILETFSARQFSLEELSHLLQEKYDMAAVDANKEAEGILSYSLRLGIAFAVGTDQPRQRSYPWPMNKLK